MITALPNTRVRHSATRYGCGQLSTTSSDSTSTTEISDEVEDTKREAESIIDSIKHKSSLPSVVYLYDDVGSSLFEDITKTEEYYPTRMELSILKNNAIDIARFVDEVSGSPRNFRHSLIELGAGSGKKLHPLLDALNSIPKRAYARCMYLPADYSMSALDENVNVYNNNRENVEPFQGTHEDALAELSGRSGRKTWAYLGSSLGNDEDPVPFLKKLAAHCGSRDRILLGIDLAAKEGKPVDVIERAYNDSQGVTSSFILNSLNVVNRVAGLDFETTNFRLVSEYNHDKNAVEMSAECIVPCQVTGDKGKEMVRSFDKGDRIFIEQSGKFTDERIENMTVAAGLIETRRWSDNKGYFSILELGPDLPGNCTKLSEFVFKYLVGCENLSDQPVELRNPFAFYWGHITAFSDRIALQLPRREHERKLYERGVDPDVDDPTKIHRHSPRFQTWPAPEEFEKYAFEVEQGLREKIVQGGVTREILISLEHAEMHHETLMYMVMQSEYKYGDDSIVHPFADFATPPTGKRAVPSEAFVRIDAAQVDVGASDEEVAALGFVWDNELPRHTVGVDSFMCSVSPITNAEFMEFLRDGGYTKRELWEENEISKKVVACGGTGSWDWVCRENMERPLLWETNGIRTLNGVVAHQDAADWPAVVSLFEAAAYCKWCGDGARIMTEPEYHALFSSEEDYNDAAKRGNNNWQYQGVVPVGSMEDANSKGIHDLVGNGWEWTSTTFAGFDGFVPLHDYEEYSTDFFDGKHFVLKGASPFTGTLAQRMSFRNWYQPNYPYPIAKFRVVKN